MQKLFLFFQLWILSTLVLMPLQSRAQSYRSAVTTATGGAGVAAIEAGDVGALNPATIVHLKGRYLFANSTSPQMSFSLSDNLPESSLPGALAYTTNRRTISGLGEVKSSDILFSLAEFISDQWAFGVTGHYAEYNLATSSYRKTNADAGIVWTPKEKLGFGAVIYNLFVADDNMPVALRLKTEGVFGVNYIYEEVIRLRLDYRTSKVLSAGFESYLNSFLIFRGGMHLEKDNIFGTLGFGFKGPRFFLNYGYSGETLNPSSLRHSVDFVIPF